MLADQHRLYSAHCHKDPRENPWQLILISTHLDVQSCWCVGLCRAQLQREKQAREDAERQRIEMQERLKQFELESKKAQEGM